MSTRHWRALLEEQWSRGHFVSVGLDSDLGQIPDRELYKKNAKEVDPLRTIARFNAAIVEATHDITGVFKPNLAFYLEHGAEGIEALKMTVQMIHRVAPQVPVILDAKFADIGNTNKGYARFAFDYLGADAVTVHPYLGGVDALAPFLSREDKGIIVLCRTSNPGGGEFQDLEVSRGSSRRPLYEDVAHRVAEVWNSSDNCGLVVGATFPEELEKVRAIGGLITILIPGVGAQGGDAETVARLGRNALGRGFIVNSSRGIIFASKEADFKDAARRETENLNGKIAQAA